ncbi:YCII-related domain protein [Aquisphaera giovannonii]|uniref:YCII-related domain protein n=1 Tax=Aquisphaera giovannonii TaxID=406548 RepID=A0A5B9VYA5_9BACT|nr:YciI family protein [Aquisphaera giovannonii]QEH32600.1 YCII-related domain protein [Aquisphaera giovannonii]
MPRFLFVYRSEPFDMSKMSPGQMQESMDRWRAWIGQGFAEGWMIDPGDALMPEGRVVTRSEVVTDGPFAESKEVLGGYSVVQAESLDAAVKHARTCPQVVEGGSVEIRPMAGLAAEPKG